MNHEPQRPCQHSNHHTLGARLLADVRPLIVEGDERALARCLRLKWSVGELAELVHATDPEVGQAAVQSLGILGGCASVLPLVGALQHADRMVWSAAEDSLWRLWFSASGVGARRKLVRAVELTREGRYAASLAVLDDLIEREPDFSEAHHQQAIAHHLQGDQELAVIKYARAASLNTCHFGAFAGAGRAHADLGQWTEAMASYRRVLQLHPRMEGIRQSIRKIHAMQGFGAPVT